MAALGNKAKMSPIRKKQFILLGGLITIVAAIALVGGILSTPKTAPVAKAPESIRKSFGAQEQVNNADFWRTQEGAKVSVLQQELGSMKEKLVAIERQREDDKKRLESDAEKQRQEEARAKEAEAEREKLRLTTQPPASGLPHTGNQTGQLGVPGGPQGSPQGEPIRGTMKIDLSSGVSGQSPQVAGMPGAPSTPSTPGAPRASGSGGGDGGEMLGSQSAETYIPSGTFMRGVLLAGLDAPTGGQAQQNPHPLVIEVMDLASLPNKFKADYKNCRVVANGTGDLSSERAYIRLDRMSCVSEDGSAIDIAIKGYIADGTGKAGIRGRLVSKQGSVLANALLSGVASGIGNAFTQSSMVTSTSPLGATQTVQSGKELQAGLGQGVGNALNQLSRYYISLAEKLFPIIEIDAGQPVDIVITKGFSVARKI